MCLLQTNCQVIQPAGSFICAGELIRCQVSNPREVLFGQANSYAARYVRPKPEIIRDLFRVRPAEYCQVTLSISARDNPRSLPGTFGRSQRQPAVSQVHSNEGIHSTRAGKRQPIFSSFCGPVYFEGNRVNTSLPWNSGVRQRSLIFVTGGPLYHPFIQTS